MAKRQRRNVRRWAGVCTGYALVLIVVSILCQTVWSTVDQSQAALLEDATERIDGSSKLIAELKPELAHLRLSLAIEKEIVSQPNWSILLALLSSKMGEQIVLRECELVPLVADGQAPPAGVPLLTAADGSVKLGSQHQLKLQGLGRSQSAVSQFVLRLEETKLFTNVKLINTMREPILSGVDAFVFRIECVLGTAPPAPPSAPQEAAP